MGRHTFHLHKSRGERIDYKKSIPCLTKSQTGYMGLSAGAGIVGLRHVNCLFLQALVGVDRYGEGIAWLHVFAKRNAEE